MKWKKNIRSLGALRPGNAKRRGLPKSMLQPFTIQDMARVPQEWNIGGPDFIGVGVQKAGTSWWHSLLLQHPQITPNRLGLKELQYFPHFLYSDMTEDSVSTYRQAFAAPAGSICGEWSPRYFYHPLCMERIAKTAPDAKILILLRNPIDRFFSGLNHFQSARIEKMQLSPKERYFYEVFSLFPESIYLSQYARGMAKLFQFFDRSKLFILQYEKCKADPYKEISRTFRFLGVEDQFTPLNVLEAVNPKVRTIPSLTPHERESLAAYFAEDVQTTAGLCPELDLSLWPEFGA